MKFDKIIALFLFCCFLEFNNCAKILIFVPVVSKSQVEFHNRVGDLLADHGHNVTLLNLQYDPDVKKGKLKSTAKEIYHKVLKNESTFREFSEMMAKTIFKESSFDLKIFSMMGKVFVDGCETQVSDKTMIKKLTNDKYDLAMTHVYDFCTIGMVKLLKIPTYIWMSSGALADYMAFAVGAPVPSSYVPGGMSALSDRMTFSERFGNFFGHLMLMPFVRMFTSNPETELFRKYHDPKFPDLFELSSKAPLVFVNSEEFLDFPRPILHKIVYMGGIGLKSPNPLNEQWQKIMDDSNDGVILFSFGSFVDPKTMPDSWRDAFLTAFSKFPSYTFVWKYAGDLPGASKVPNIIVHNWVPQIDMFGHPKMKAFITHAGMNSLLEASTNGIPLVVIPLYGDQLANRKKAERHGIAIGIDKKDVTAKHITNALERILQNSTYKENAERLARMIRNKPFKTEEVTVRWVDFLAEFKQLPNLEPVGAELSLVEYFLMDVLASILLGLILLIYIVYRVVYFLYGKACAQSHTNTKRKAD